MHNAGLKRNKSWYTLEIYGLQCRYKGLQMEKKTYQILKQDVTEIRERVLHSTTYAAMGGGGVWPLRTRLYKGGSGPCVCIHFTSDQIQGLSNLKVKMKMSNISSS